MHYMANIYFFGMRNDHNGQAKRFMTGLIAEAIFLRF